MKNIFSVFLISIIVFLSINTNAQVNRRDTKKSVAYRGNYQRIATGGYSYHCFEIRLGALWGWGYNNRGQLGDGTTTDDSIPKQIGTDNNWVTVSTGLEFTVGIKADGTLWAWGQNATGELGDGTNVNSPIPKQIGTDNKWIAVDCGGQHTLALKSDGTLWAWGVNSSGRLGDGTTTNRNSPVQIGTDNKWASIEAGYAPSFGIKSDGTLWSWGENWNGVLGDGTTTNRTSPVQIGSDNKWVKVSAGEIHALGLKSDGTLWAWGSNTYNQIGDGTSTNRNSPVQIGTDNKWVDISTGQQHSHALKSDGTLWSWGDNASGKLGDGTTTIRNRPTQIGTDNKWINIKAGNFNSMGLKSDGTLWSWGNNFYGQLGNGTTTDQFNPVQIRTAPDEWLSTTGGGYYTMGLKSDGTIWSWGLNNSGQLGSGTTTNSNSPTQIGSDTDWVSVEAGYESSLGLKSDGTLWAWGNNQFGQLGLGDVTSRNAPTRIGTDNNWVSISSGDHSMALKSDGTLWGWGYNANGEIGDGSTTERHSPVQVGTDNKWVSFGVHGSHMLALKCDGTIWAWGGNNASGALGAGSTFSNQLTPLQIGTAKIWVSIANGGDYNMGIQSDGTLWAWGANSFGALGDGTTTTRSTPVKIGSDTKWINIAGGGGHSFGIKSDGILWAWGDNTYGGLGDGTITQRNAPTQILTDQNWVSIATSTGSHSIGIKADRSKFCATGYNIYGQLGDGTTADKNTFTCSSNLVLCSPPAAPTAADKTICSGNTTSLSATRTGTLGWYTASTGGTYLGGGSNYTTPVLTNNATYYVQDSTCAVSTTRTAVTVTVNALPIVTVNSTANTICAGGSVTLTGSGSSSYSWSDGVTNGVSFIPSSTHTYSVTGTDANSCSNTATKTISVNTLPTVTATASANTVCAGTSTTLSGQGASSYSWSDGVSDGVSFIPSLSQTYTVTGTDANNCSTTSTINIHVNTKPSVTANASSQTLCSGASTTLTGSGATSYVWTDGVNNGVAFNPTATKSYTLTGTDANNCSDTATISIYVNQLPVVTAQANATTVCAGVSVTLSGSGASSYSWTDGVNEGVSFVPPSTHTYTVTGTDANNCTDTDAITIHVNTTAGATVTASASLNTVCVGASTTLSGQGASSYSWSDGLSDGVAFAPLVTKTYTVTGTDANGCSSQATTTIVVNTLPSIVANTSSNMLCGGGSATLFGTSTPINNQITYSWSDGVNDGVAFIPTVTKTYTVTGTDSNGCTNKDTITIHVSNGQALTVTANASANTVCAGTSTTLSGQGAASYSWSDGVNDGVSFIPSATKTYTVTGTDANGCSGSAATTVVVLPIPNVLARASHTTICVGDSIFLSSEGNAVSYSWVGNMVDSLNFAPASTQSYTLTGMGNNGCGNSSAVDVVVYSLPLVGVNGAASQTIVCGGDPVTLAGSGADRYYWSGGITDNQPFSPQITTTYILTGITNNTCDNTTSVTITVNKTPVLSTISNPSSAAVCAGASVTLSGQGAVSYVWSDNVADGVPFIPLSTHTYTLIGTDSNNCTASVIRVLSVFPLPNVGITVFPNTTICLGDSVRLNGTGADTYVWSDNVIDSLAFFPMLTATYTVTGGNQYACTDTASLRISVEPCTDTIIGVGIQDMDNTLHERIVYPNPNNGEFTVTLSTSTTLSAGSVEGITAHERMYCIIDELGQIIQQIKLNSSNTYSVNIEDLSSGIYFLVGYNKGIITRQKIVVTK